MNEAKNQDEPHATTERRKSHFPKITLLVTVITAIVWFVTRNQFEALNDWLNINPGILNLLPYFLIFITALFWLGWIIFGSGLSKGFAIPLALIPVIAFMGYVRMYQPIFDGDARIVRWQTRNAKRDNFVQLPPDEASRTNQDESSTDPVNGQEFVTTPNDFPQFLGPNRDARLPNLKLSRDWKSNPPEQVWKQPIGEGWSGFVIVNGNAVTLEQRNELECVTCYDVETGQLKWIHSEPRRHEDSLAMGRVGPRATPVIHEGKVYAQGGTGVLECLNLTDGELCWSVDLPKLLDITQQESVNRKGMSYTEESNTLAWGRSGSPLIHNGMVIVPGGGPLGGPFVTLLGFDLKTGDEKWRAGKRMIAYGSPSLATIAGIEQILLVTEAAAVGHHATTGVEVWIQERLGASNGQANCSQVTVVDETHVLLSKGYNMGGELLQIEPVGSDYQIESKWKNPRVLKTKLTNPIVHQGHAYSLSDGFLECVSIMDNRRKWKKRARYGNGQVLLVGDLLLVHAEQGSLFLVEANPEKYNELGRMQKTIDGVCWNPIALYGDLLLVRSELESACIRLPLAKPLASDTNSAASQGQ